jgi:uncharacterized protein YecT (DUF1311 family)
MRSSRCTARLTSVGLALFLAHIAPALSQERNVTRCLSIADVDERVECLEGRAPAPLPSPGNPPKAGRPTQTRAAPSFDCRAAASSIERAICSDDMLAEWDSRMGQAFQQSLRLRKGSPALLEDQRRWLSQRDRNCGGGLEIPRSCLLEMTKRRVSALVEEFALDTDLTPSSSPMPSPTRVPLNQRDVSPDVPPNQGGAASPQLPPETKSPPALSTDQSLTPLFLLIALGLGLWLVLMVVRNLRRKKRLADIQADFARRRQGLVAKYGEAVASRILAREVWQGMTDEQLREAWGNPADIGREVSRAKVKETWKYGQTGKNRFRQRVSLEDGIVTGWKI